MMMIMMMMRRAARWGMAGVTARRGTRAREPRHVGFWLGNRACSGRNEITVELVE